MGTVVYWFSGTGNSLSAAKTLAARLDADLIPMTQALKEGVSPAERIGLVFPVYSFGPPALVERFVGTLNLLPETVVFSVITFAAAAGGTFRLLNQMLEDRGLMLSAGWGLKMPENYPPLGGALAEEKQHELNRAAKEKAERIAEQLMSPVCRGIEPSGVVWNLLTRAAHPLFRRTSRRLDRFFRADAACNGCGICEKICPVDNIVMVGGRPVWRGRCEQCFACLHWCPQEAVQYIRSKKQPRYHHPETSCADFLDVASGQNQAD
jgi:ferredoxin